MKKLLLTALTASVLILPFAGTALALPEEAAAPIPVQEYLPGRVPAQTDVAESMSPALHAVALAMINQDASRFDPDDSELVWESLYNLLSLYGQLDNRVVQDDDILLLPEETAWDYAAALALDLDGMGNLPAGVLDRLSYDNFSHSYVVTPGEDGLSQIEVRGIENAAGGLRLTGALVYLPDGRDLIQFQADLQLRDNMFGYSLTGMRLTDRPAEIG